MKLSQIGEKTREKGKPGNKKLSTSLILKLFKCPEQAVL
jgi:hypothetical protein